MLEQNGVSEYRLIKLADISRCITEMAKAQPRGISTVLEALHSFSGFMVERHPDFPDISPALIGAPAKHRKIYEGYSRKEAHKILAYVDRNTIIGKRDYAMLLLAYNTGLRGVDNRICVYAVPDIPRSFLKAVCP